MRLGIVLVAGVVLGALTSVGQTFLPDALRPLANSATPWSIVAFGLSLLARRTRGAVVLAVAAFVTLLLGYELASELRFGYGMSTATRAFWAASAVVVGPVLGALGAWARRDPGTGRSVTVAAVTGLAVGEGVYGVTSLPTTSPVWWSISIVLGLAGLVAFGVRRRAPRQALLAIGGTVVVAGAFVVVYGLGSGLL